VPPLGSDDVRDQPVIVGVVRLDRLDVANTLRTRNGADPRSPRWDAASPVAPFARDLRGLVLITGDRDRDGRSRRARAPRSTRARQSVHGRVGRSPRSLAGAEGRGRGRVAALPRGARSSLDPPEQQHQEGSRSSRPRRREELGPEEHDHGDPRSSPPPALLMAIRSRQWGGRTPPPAHEPDLADREPDEHADREQRISGPSAR